MMSILKRFQWMLVLLLAQPLMANAQTDGVDATGWYVGGAVGQYKLNNKYKDFFGSTGAASSEGLSAYGGYNFNRMFGLEATVSASSNLAEDSSYDAALSEIAFTPKLTIPVGKVSNRVSFYLKGGLAIASYSEKLNYGISGLDNEFVWGGYGLTAGTGIQVAVMKHLFIRLSYDYSDLKFEPTKDTATIYDPYYGVVIVTVPKIDSTLNRTSIGMHYQF